MHALVYQVLTRDGDLARRVPVAARLVDAMVVAGGDGSWVVSESYRVAEGCGEAAFSIQHYSAA